MSCLHNLILTLNLYVELLGGTTVTLNNTWISCCAKNKAHGKTIQIEDCSKSQSTRSNPFSRYVQKVTIKCKSGWLVCWSLTSLSTTR